MASLKETKTHIGSVKSTLKITSAMKLVAAAKLHRAQQAVENIRPYAARLSEILSDIPAVSTIYNNTRASVSRVAIVAFASNSSLCGGFNANALRLVLETIDAYRAAGIEDITVFSIGRKLSDALKKVGYPSPVIPSDSSVIPSEAKESISLSALSEHPSYPDACHLADALAAAFADGTYDRIDLVYNHFFSTASQKPVRSSFLPLADSFVAAAPQNDKVVIPSDSSVIPSASSVIPSASSVIPSEAKESTPDYLIEPSAPAAYAALLPQVIRLSLYTALLDSAAAEHAARTIAMQTATDNAEDLLDELTLEYNKARQQKITAEILDIVGGSMQ